MHATDHDSISPLQIPQYARWYRRYIEDACDRLLARAEKIDLYQVDVRGEEFCLL
jgi:hypothetical protein